MQLLTDVWKESSARFQNFASYVSQEVEKSLQQVRLTTGAHDQVQFLLPQVPALNVAEDSFEEAWTGLFTGGLVGLLLWGPWGLALAAGGWLAGVFLGRERRRKREIARIIERAQASLTAALDTVFVQFGEKIRIFFRSLERHVTDRISVFIHDIEGQLQKLDTPVPPEEQRRLADHEKAVRATLEALADVCGQLGLESRRDA